MKNWENINIKKTWSSSYECNDSTSESVYWEGNNILPPSADNSGAGTIIFSTEAEGTIVAAVSNDNWEII